MRPTSLRGYLIVLVLALALPAIALEFWWGYQDYRDARTQAQLEALNAAELVSTSVQQFLTTAGELLAGASRERLYGMEEPRGCDGVVSALTEVLPFFENAVVQRPDGTALCSARPAPEMESVFTTGWPPAEGEARVGDPIHDLELGQWVLPIAVPVRLGDGAEPGALVGIVPLSEFNTLVRGVSLGPDDLTTIATERLQVITRSSDAGAWAGQYLPEPENTHRVVGPGQRVVSGPDAENVQRAWGITRVGDLGWEVYVGVAEAEVNAPAMRATIRRVGSTAFFLFLGIVVATVSYAQIARSLRELVTHARTAARDRVAPLPPGTPREVSAVVEQLNRTLDERDTAEAAERQALERYATIFNDAIFGIFVATPDGWILEANPALASMLGASEIRQVLDRPLRHHFLDPDQHDIMLATCLAEGSVEEFLAEWRRADGQTIVVRIDGKRVGTESGYEGIEMIVDDVTEELRRDQEVQQTQKMEAIGRLAGGIAHDFNNLLTVISANAELIDEGLTEDSALRTDLRQIQKASDRAASLTRQLLAFSRSDTSEMRAVDLNAVVADLDAMLRRLIGDDIRLETSLGADVPTIQADPSRIEQVVMNLVLNARDALPRGGSIRISTARVPGPGASPEGSRWEVLLTVEDDGEGMDDATRGRIFEPFFTTKKEGRGTGLGLATVYGIVQQAGGRIEVRSELSEGTRFRIWLPVRAARGHAVPDEERTE